MLLSRVVWGFFIVVFQSPLPSNVYLPLADLSASGGFIAALLSCHCEEAEGRRGNLTPMAFIGVTLSERSESNGSLFWVIPACR